MRSAIRSSIWGAATVIALFLAGPARAQDALPPLPAPIPEPAPSPSTAQPPPPPAPSATAPPPTQYAYAPPPPGPAGLSNAERKHAPQYSLWLGARAGLLVYSGGLYINDALPPPGSSGVETTGDFVRPGLALQADAGARIGWRFIPYLTLEWGLVGAGRRFDGTPTTASTSFVGVGFRYLAGDVDSVSFASDISLGVRRLQVSNPTSTWSASAFEFLRIGFGADIRLSSHATLSPMLTLSSGTLTDTSGYIAFAPNQPDMQTHPLFTGNGGIPPWAQQSYFVIVLGCGVHFDLFGK